jgi:hypothetical protein
LGTPGRYHSGRPPYGFVLSVDLDSASGAVRRLRIVPILVDNSVVAFRPVVADDPAAGELLASLLTRELDWYPDHAAGWAAELPDSGRTEVPALDGRRELLEP